MRGRRTLSPARHARRGSGQPFIALIGVLILAGGGYVGFRALGNGHPAGSQTPAPTTSNHTYSSAPPTTPPPTTTPPPVPSAPFAVGVRQLTFTDTSRTIPATHTTTGLPGPRVLHTWIWYPAQGTGSGLPVPGLAPEPAGGPYPLIVFGHGYNLSPTDYQVLLQSWVRRGYVVAAPAFPLEIPGAIGQTDSDEKNQPGDMSFVITQMLRLNHTSSSFLNGMLDPSEIAASGQSDGANTALAAGDASCCRDPRIDATLVLAGQIESWGGTYFSSGHDAPLLAVQGSADAVNDPQWSNQVYAAAHPPKYLLWLTGAGHLDPFTYANPYETIVRHVTLAFLDHYLKGLPVKVSVQPPSAQATLTAAP